MRDQLEQRDSTRDKGTQVLIKAKIRETKEDIEQNIQTLKAILRNKRKKCSSEELANKHERVQKLLDNIAVLDEMFVYQNKEQRKKIVDSSSHQESGVGDIESEMLLQPSRANGKFEGFHTSA